APPRLMLRKCCQTDYGMRIGWFYRSREFFRQPAHSECDIDLWQWLLSRRAPFRCAPRAQRRVVAARLGSAALPRTESLRPPGVSAQLWEPRAQRALVRGQSA